MTEHLNIQAQHQYKDLVVHCKRQPYDVYVGRPSRGAPKGDLCEWGNPFNMKNQSQAERNRVVHEYRCWLVSQPDLVQRAQTELKGKVLACWCSPKLCHGHVLAEVANSPKYAADLDKEEEKEDVIAENVQIKGGDSFTLADDDFPALGASTTKKASTNTVTKQNKPNTSQHSNKHGSRTRLETMGARDANEPTKLPQK